MDVNMSTVSLPTKTKKGARHYALREGRLVMTTTSGIHCLGASRGKL